VYGKSVKSCSLDGDTVLATTPELICRPRMCVGCTRLHYRQILYIWWIMILVANVDRNI